MTKLRFISDLHCVDGINLVNFKETFGKELAKEKDCITLIAGDLADSVNTMRTVLETYFQNQKVYFVGGNHDGVYNYDEIPLPEFKNIMSKEFSAEHALWHYLENDWAFIPGTNDSVAIIGSTFYTDYEYCNFTLKDYNSRQESWDVWAQLYGLKVTRAPKAKRLTKALIREYNMDYARDYLNDFRWGYETKTKNLSPEYYRQLNKLAKKKIVECYNKIQEIRPGCKVILMTHHCLSKKCIANSFTRAKTNGSYVSDLETWLCKEMPNLRLVFSGHVHHRMDFKFGKDNKRYILNPCGYIFRAEHLGDIPFNPNFIIDTIDL